MEELVSERVANCSQNSFLMCRTEDSLTGRGGGKDLFNGSEMLVTSPSKIA